MTSEQKNKLVEAAKSFLGKKYYYGSDPEKTPDALDCSAFVQQAFEKIGIELPRSSILQAADKKGMEIKPKDDFSNLETGDLLFMRSDRGFYYDELFEGRKISIGHVVIYLGNGEIIHSSKSKNGISIDNLNKIIIKPNYEIVFVKRF